MPAAHAEEENRQGKQEAADHDSLEREPNYCVLHLSHRIVAAISPTCSDTTSFFSVCRGAI